MNTIDFNQVKKVHIIGIGGIGISALARLLVHEGKEVSGTEDNQSPETLDELRAQGVVVTVDADPKELPPADFYIYSDGWLTKHPEIIEKARTGHIPALSYFEALGQIANRYDVIAISGAHGKTTTTAMTIDVLEAGGLDPSGVVGSLRAKTKSNYRAGKGKYFIAEADEYLRHFLQLQPKILVITNLDNDHLDYYRNFADIQSAFREMALKVPADGFIVCNEKDENLRPVIQNLPCIIIDYMRYFDPNLKLATLPLHRINAAAVLAVADIVKVPDAVARQALVDFAGTWRRFEYKGVTAKGALVYDDYAHHPTEVKTTLHSVREQFPDKRLVVAFHPHLYSRTKILFNDFAAAFSDADDIIIAPIFAAREEPDPAISHTSLAAKIRESGKNARSLDSFEEIEKYLAENTTDKDIIVTMGAGDIYKIAEMLTGKK